MLRLSALQGLARWSAWAIALVLTVDRAEGSGDPPSLGPGRPVEASIAPGEQHRYRLEAPAGGPWLLSIEQVGIDVSLELVAPGSEAQAVDGPFDRFGLESLVLTAAASGAEVVVRANEVGAPHGHYLLRFESVAAGVLEAERAYSRAGAHYHRGERRQAFEQYGRARQAFEAAGEREAAARSLYAAAVLARLLGQSSEARDLAAGAVERWRALGERAFESAAENELGLSLWLLGDATAARGCFERSLALAAEAGFPYGEAVAQANLCLLHLSRGELEGGLACYQEALPRLAAVQAVALEGAAWTNVGRARDSLGRPEEASQAYDRALELVRRAGNREGEARLANNLGVLAQQMGELEVALARYGEALAAFREVGDRRWQAWTLGNVASLYLGLDRLDAAQAAGREALGLWRELGEPAGQAAALTTLGLVAAREADPASALDLHEQAVELRRGLGDGRGLGLALTQLARARLAGDELSPARAAIAEALALLDASGEPKARAEALLVAAEVDLAGGDPAGARQRLVAAQALAGSARDRPTAVRAGVARAELERRAGRPREALAEVSAALDVLETLRPAAGSGDLAASFSAVQQRAFDLAIGLSMEFHRAEPQAGWERQGLAFAEKARSRALLDVLAAARVSLGRGDGALSARKRSLERQLAALAARALGGREALLGKEAQLGEEARLSTELDLTEARLRTADPAYAELTRVQPLSAAEIQARLAPSTLLLVYRLGGEQSHLWALSRESLEAFALPPGREIEAAVRSFHERVARFAAADRAEQAALAATLSRLLLEPVADRLAAKRLAIVADGALAYLPFAALPAPVGAAEAPADSGPAPLLIEGRELLSLPSASVLEALESGLEQRPAAPRRALVLADPAGAALPPLPGARREAEAIAALAPAGEVTVLVGQHARREALLGPAAKTYRVLHLATHGLLDTDRPALSGLLLADPADSQEASLPVIPAQAGIHPLRAEAAEKMDPRLRGDDNRTGVSETDVAEPGFLGLADLYSLDLGADLVVLSACRTALGKELRGEGLSGLARGFLYAGVPRVVASLWPVEDRATARLMTELYRGLWQRGLPPAAALAEAQRAVRAERRWQDPYFWAGFTLQGAW